MPTPTAAEPVLGLLLAGGAGHRVGGADKGMLPFGTSTLAGTVAARLRPQVDRLLVACNRHATRYAALGDGVVKDRRPLHQGPLAGLEAALAELPPNWLLALAPCDVPALPVDLVATLRGALVARSDAVTWARAGGRDHYLCALLTAEAAHQVGAYLDAGGRSVRGWYDTLAGSAVGFSDEADAFSNYNQGPGSGSRGAVLS
ncbi:molybdenum cofactor guanylyltransferase MobA [Pseudohaliea rubra]|uniref:Molybdenum cofactor guanylyltransferase n=1 Tax=Pseudohaliea rubra DSM 19751 TaxID=1265313 RepID=A0A095VN97_9GAMM|nr:molybdenum cofactor guanylyltransferase MobA [Pseudohaliea rubra]KGE02865.1 Molybdopterin-guanine dinucleotide biosynthesis protein MobA [Pseudohaliea rubra DSM 19751]